MNTIVKAGLILGILVEVWSYVYGFAGWYKDPALVNLFYCVMLIHVGVLIWGLRQTAAAGRKYGGQVGAGTLISAIGAVIIFAGSILFTTVVFPEYFSDVQAMMEQMLSDKGMSGEEIQQVLDAQAAFSNPLVNAITGAVMTIIFGCIFSLIIAIFVKAKDSSTPQKTIA